jgi:hypothetical protein
MQFSFSHTGKPAEIRAKLQDTIKRARKDGADAGVTGALSDAVGRKLAPLGPDAEATVSIAATITFAAVERKDGKPMTRNAAGLVEGEPAPEGARSLLAADPKAK